ncbi:hypothetical protein CL628_01385 [bacterium]|nr:hypothetical protein [bacterium]
MSGQNYIVVGGKGFIGSAVTKRLHELGNNVTVISRSRDPDPYKVCDLERVTFVSADVTNSVRFWEEVSELPESHRSVIYAVGDCPEQGFDAAVRNPLSTEDGVSALVDEISMHAIGLANAVSRLLPKIADGGSLVVIGSDITRLNKGADRPEWLQAGHYAAAKAAQATMVQGWYRRDPGFTSRNILAHLIEPGAVDGPFHEGSAHPKPPTISVARVVEAVVIATLCETGQEFVLLPQ